MGLQFSDTIGNGVLLAPAPAAFRTPPMTVTAWVYPTKNAGDCAGGQMMIVGLPTGNVVEPYWSWWMNFYSGGSGTTFLQALCEDGAGNYYFTGSQDCGINDWHFCTFTIDSSGTMIALRDGYDAGAHGSITVPMATGASQTFEIGTGTGSFCGTIADVRIYNRVLSSNELLTMQYCRGNDAIAYGLIGRWLMDEGGFGTSATGAGSVLDCSTTNFDLNPTGSPLYVGVGLKLKRQRQYL